MLAALNHPPVAALYGIEEFDLHPDGSRAVGAWLAEGDTMPKRDGLVIVFNFLDELRRAVGARP